MPFISLEFLALVGITLGFYYAFPERGYQVGVLVTASLIFYGWDQWRLLPLLIAAVAITYFAMLGSARRCRGAATAGISANLAILAFFKYKFLVFPHPNVLATGSGIVDELLKLPLPIGISFFVFHNISLIVDRFRLSDEPPPGPLDVLLYILFFPQLISGPITKANSFLPQIVTKRFQDVAWIQATELIITGLFFKLFCANNLAQVTAAMDPEFLGATGGQDKMFLILAYSCQIYADFFGYSTIALGIALLFGYRLPVNFRLPYTATSFSDFWNRWHISLSRWLRQYLYIPLGGSRITRGRTYANLMTVMILGGLWHGAALSYAVWGFAHGLLLAMERSGGYVVERVLPRLGNSRSAKCGYSFLVFTSVSLCWVLFRFHEFHDVRDYFMAIASDPWSANFSRSWYRLALLYMAPIAIQHAFSSWRFPVATMPRLVVGSGFGVILWLALAERGLDTPFIYFRF